MRMLIKETRARLQGIISRLANGSQVTLNERIQLHKYSKHIPFIYEALKQALNKREDLDGKNLV